MGEMAQKIVKTDIQTIINELNIAFSEEWLAYYQYWIGAQVAVGPMRTAIVREFLEHAHQEFEHAGKLANRIVQLGGKPVLNPNEWEKIAQCRYDEPKNPQVARLVEQNLIAERCAVARYQKICEMTHGTDFETFRLSSEILREEIEHEQEMEDFKNDMIS